MSPFDGTWKDDILILVQTLNTTIFYEFRINFVSYIIGSRGGCRPNLDYMYAKLA